MSEPTSLDFRVLGPLRVCGPNGDVALGGQKQRAVLAVLLTERGSFASFDSIANRVWNGNPPATHKAGVQVYVSALRQLLSSSSRGPIESGSGGYRLVVKPENFDWLRFQHARAEGARARAAGRPDQAARGYRAALAEWDRTALSDLRGFHFADTFAVALEEDRLSTVQECIEAELARGSHGALVAELTVLTREHPLREGFWTQLMMSLHRSGRQADALAVYRRMWSTLTDAGYVVSPWAQRVEQAIQRHEDIDGPIAAGPVPRLDRTLVETRTKQPPAALRLPDGTRIDIPAGGLRIGREPDNDLVLTDPKASRRHAVIVVEAVGYSIADLHSSNRTWVNGTPIAGSHLLVPGTVIRIGDTSFVVEIDQSGHL